MAAPNLPCPGPPGADTPWLDEREDRAWRGWLAASELLRAQTGRDLLADSGLSEADYVVLVYLSEIGDRRARMSDLAAALRWSKSRLSHQVARMEARGLLAREGCGSDGRGAFAVLTDAGMAELRSAAPAHVASVRAHFIDLLGDEELEVLGAVTARLVEHLLAQPGAPSPPAACGERERAGAGPDADGGGTAGKLVG
jgi:DNA-binding MarR family transcriptional regulator